MTEQAQVDNNQKITQQPESIVIKIPVDSVAFFFFAKPRAKKKKATLSIQFTLFKYTTIIKAAGAIVCCRK